MKDFMIGITPSSDADLLHLSEGSTDFIGLSFMDMTVEKEKEENKNE